LRRIVRLLQEKQIDVTLAAEMVSFRRWVDSLNAEEYYQLVKVIAGPNLECAGTAIALLGMWFSFKRPSSPRLAEFVWTCLEATPSVTANNALDFDGLASKLATSDPERGFKLLIKLVTESLDKGGWNPISLYGSHRFWKQLCETDHKRVLRTILSLGIPHPLKQSNIQCYYRHVIEQERTSDLLIELAGESEYLAEQVCRTITPALPGFWPIALKIVERYPQSKGIKMTLTAAVKQMGGITCEPHAAHLKSRRQEVMKVLNNHNIPSACRKWLRELESSLLAEINVATALGTEEDETSSISARKKLVAPEQLWAMARLLQEGKLTDVQKVLSKEEILNILPKLPLNKSDQAKVQKKIEDCNQ